MVQRHLEFLREMARSVVCGHCGIGEGKPGRVVPPEPIHSKHVPEPALPIGRKVVPAETVHDVYRIQG